MLSISEQTWKVKFRLKKAYYYLFKDKDLFGTGNQELENNSAKKVSRYLLKKNGRERVVAKKNVARHCVL